jgi:AcrR family transcriptional regulator
MATSPLRRPAIDRSREAVLETVTAILVDRPDASLAEIAGLIGIGRTTLYRLFPTREAVLRAVALDAIGHLSEVYAVAGIPGAFLDPAGDAESLAAIRRLVELLIPLGPRLTFLLRARELDTDEAVNQELDALNAILVAAVERGQAAGALSRQAPASWWEESLYALVYSAWEQIELGSLATLAAPGLVLDTWLFGAAGRAPRD